MYTNLAHTIIPLSLLGSTLAGVIRIRGEDDNNYDPKKHHDDNDKDHNDHDYHEEVSPEFIGCVSRTFFNLVSSDDNFDGDFTEQPDLNTCIDHCVDEKFRYTYWDADRKQCYCSPTQRPDADQIRDNDSVTGRCKNRDAIVFLNNANFKFGGCFDRGSGSDYYGVTPVARFSTTSVRDCFVLCDEPCRDKFVEVVAITPRFDPALYSFAYDCECFDINYDDIPPLVNRTCAIDSVFGYARGDHHDDHNKKEAKRGKYDYDYDYDYGYKGDHKDHEDHKGYDDDEDRDKDHDYKHHDEENDYDHGKDEEYDPDHHKDDYNNDDSKDYGYHHKGKDHDSHKDDDDDEDYSPDYGYGKKHHEQEDDHDDYDYAKKHHEDKEDEEGDEDYHKGKDHEQDDEDEDYDYGKKHHEQHEEEEGAHGKDYDDEDHDRENDDDNKHHDDNHENKKHDDEHDYDYGYYGKGELSRLYDLVA
ncbi:hypothetical protein I302_104219 [Kwoniella bestiolae CBS 10118]|uniref:Apple domain-containing protein n=1 Tax=Kwoniella bestiolae CBS 10118 TaxID=1296100 RepID=A0A1B9GAL8_9TREE|nr:hypothetical protein I302_02928 [Kwoniella bestiolae CBS 10118]OCF28077.1 hypothetical protein I302_02928 [Kwoniella bestiolae CBS 10118]